MKEVCGVIKTLIVVCGFVASGLIGFVGGMNSQEDFRNWCDERYGTKS